MGFCAGDICKFWDVEEDDCKIKLALDTLIWIGRKQEMAEAKGIDTKGLMEIIKNA